MILALDYEDRPACRAYAQKPERTWNQDTRPSASHEWFISSKPWSKCVNVSEGNVAAKIVLEANAALKNVLEANTALRNVFNANVALVALKVLDNPYHDIDKAIEESKSLLELPEGWDDEGASPISHETWKAATEYLRHIVVELYRKTGVVLSAPTIGPCPDGSLDLFWRTATFKLLINIKPNAEESDYYGEATTGEIVKGPFDPSKSLNLLQLLVQ